MGIGIIFYFVSSAIAAQQNNINNIVIASGSIESAYYPIAQKLCKYINSSSNVKCRVMQTSGDKQNIELLEKGKVDLALVQVDNIRNNIKQGSLDASILQKEPQNGSHKISHGFSESVFNDVVNGHFRQVLALYDEVFTIIVKQDSKINTFSDLTGKKVSVVEYESGEEAYNLLIANSDVSLPELVNGGSYMNYVHSICRNKVDSLVAILPDPAHLINTLLAKCPVRIIGMNQQFLDKILQYPNYYKYSINPEKYKIKDKEINTFATKILLIANKNFSDRIVYNLVNLILNDKLQEFKGYNPVLHRLTKDSLLKQWIPLHKGVIKTIGK